MLELWTLDIMDAASIPRIRLHTKVWDFIFGSFLVGGAPVGTYWLLAMVLDWPCRLVFRHYGDHPAFILQMITPGIATVAAAAMFGWAIFWRTRHRLLPSWLLGVEVIVGIIGAVFFFLFIGLCYGPNDDWNR